MEVVAKRIVCASLAAVDGDTVRCDGELLRMLGQLATERLAEILEEPGVTIEDSGASTEQQKPRRLVTLRLPDGGTVGQLLIDEGLAMPWAPGDPVPWGNE